MKIHTVLWKCKNFIKFQQFFEAHEFLESIWIDEKQNKNFQIKGCIQFFASLELLKRNKSGSIAVFNRALNYTKNPKLRLLFEKIYNKYKTYYKK